MVLASEQMPVGSVRVAEFAHMVQVHDEQVLECSVAEPAHVIVRRLEESRNTGISLPRAHAVGCGPMHLGRLLRRLITSPAMVSLTFSSVGEIRPLLIAQQANTVLMAHSLPT